jgi:hypothetical protein
MKRVANVVILLPVLSTLGCGSIFFLNIGGVAKTAATTGPAMAPEVQCAALAATSISGTEAKAVNLCNAAVAEQRLLDEQKAKK